MKKRRGANMLRTEQEEKGMISEDDNVYCICRRGQSYRVLSDFILFVCEGLLNLF